MSDYTGRVWVSDSEADTLFFELRSAKPSEQIERLQFVVDWLNGTRVNSLFEYDTDLNHTLYLLGLSHESEGRFSEAALFFRSAIEVWPQDIAAYIAFSNVSDNLNDQIEVLENGLKHFDDPRVRLNLAHAYGDNGNASMALHHLSAIPKNWPEYSIVGEDIEIMKGRLS